MVVVVDDDDDAWFRRLREDTDSSVEGSLSAEVSLVTLDMLEIIIQVDLHLLFTLDLISPVLCLSVCLLITLDDVFSYHTILSELPPGELEETTRTSSHHVDEDYPAGPGII